MSDFSLFSLFTAGLACMIPFTAAYTKPVGDQPKGNPISQPGLNSVVPVGESFAVTWDPTTSGTVTLVLLKGPASNAVPQYAIVEKIKNNGRYIWTPSDDLAPSDPSTPAMGYGIQLIDDENGQYQYTTQFGISNPHYKAHSSSSSSSATSTSAESTAATWTHGGHGPHGIWPTNAPYFTTYCSESMTLTMYNHTYTTSGSVTITKPATYSTGWAPMGTGHSSKPSNVTMVAPTAYHPSHTLTSTAVVSVTSGPSATFQSPSAQTGAASNMASSFFGLVAAAGVAVLAI